jgi:hypothetical protein
MSSQQQLIPAARPNAGGGGMVGYIFPDKMKDNESDSVRSLRSTVLLLIVGHLICGILNVAFIGSFLGALAQILYIAMLYSIY